MTFFEEKQSQESPSFHEPDGHGPISQITQRRRSHLSFHSHTTAHLLGKMLRPVIGDLAKENKSAVPNDMDPCQQMPYDPGVCS